MYNVSKKIFHHTTLKFRIAVHVRLFIWRQKTRLYGLIRDYTFISYTEKNKYLHVCFLQNVNIVHVCDWSQPCGDRN